MSKEIDSSFQRAFENAVVNRKSTSSNEMNGIIECEVCESVFLKRQDFNRHICTSKSTNSNKTNGIIECEECKRVFLKRQDFNKHLCTTKSKRSCPVCQKTFQYLFRLKDHMNLHSGAKPYECKVCKKRFSQKSYLSSHVVKHKKVKPFKCNFCDKSYTQSGSLREHIYTHTGEKPFKCKHCDKSFFRKTSYNLHNEIHEADQPYVCNVCLKQFTRKLYLKRHKNVHEFEKPYKCNVCGKTFSLPSGLVEHMYSHSGQRPHKCDECDKTFTRKSTLVKHRELHKPGPSKVPRCHVCNKRFMNNFSFERHIYVPNGCDKSSKVCVCTPEINQNALQGPVSKKDMYKCQACSKIVFHKSSFMEHIAVHRDFKCLQCDEIYANCGCFKPSMENCDLVEDDLKCNLCDTQFFDETQLYKHLLNHKCMVCYLPMNNCMCPKDDVDKQLKSTDSGCTEEDSVEFADENLTIKEEDDMDIKSPKVYEELFETYEKSAEMTKEFLAIDKNLVKIDEKPAIIGDEFTKGDNDPEDFKSQFKLN